MIKKIFIFLCMLSIVGNISCNDTTTKSVNSKNDINKAISQNPKKIFVLSPIQDEYLSFYDYNLALLKYLKLLSPQIIKHCRIDSTNYVFKYLNNNGGHYNSIYFSDFGRFGNINAYICYSEGDLFSALYLLTEKEGKIMDHLPIVVFGGDAGEVYFQKFWYNINTNEWLTKYIDLEEYYGRFDEYTKITTEGINRVSIDSLSGKIVEDTIKIRKNIKINLKSPPDLSEYYGINKELINSL